MRYTQSWWPLILLAVFLVWLFTYALLTSGKDSKIGWGERASAPSPRSPRPQNVGWGVHSGDTSLREVDSPILSRDAAAGPLRRAPRPTRNV